ncbi:hypothetical protein QAD02_017019 [Eretmocerus hayati]|uniref:Uncharacterized protein n=1 Tax=Eretmocerus hayati TaxID=131215 RepID=A0ACC2PD31_9HYME|nr:hypothetical protein QAD02_017019 [Eretmocerus hayati]
MIIERDKSFNNNVVYYHSYKYHSLDILHRIEKMHGIKRVVVFCILTTVLPTILLVVPLYLRHSAYADVQFAVTESDILEISDGISPIFCSAHRLKMNESFNAFQVSRRPEKTSYRKHIRLKKSMTLPDDTLEYWGFYLQKGATVALSVCSRYDGSSILVVKGERNLNTCGMLDHNNNKLRAGSYLPRADKQVKVIFESNAQEIHSKEFIPTPINRESHQISALNHTNGNSLESTKKSTNVTKNPGSNLDQDRNENKGENTLNDENKELKTFFENAEGYRDYMNLTLDEQNSTDKVRHMKGKTTKLKADNDNMDPIIHRKTHRKDPEAQKRESERQKERALKFQVKEFNREDAEQEDHAKEEDFEMVNIRNKRSQQPIKPDLLDRGIRHGGNAGKTDADDSDSSFSSFENGLLDCYDGNVLLRQNFDSSLECKNVSYLLTGNKHMQTIHEVSEDGYYYYIFYSDNDPIENDIHAVFDIYKPTLQYENVTKACVNKTECSFPLSMSSIDRVIVEVPTRDGIDHELDDLSILISTCVPRMGIYVIFPITVLFLVLGCAFM